MVQPMIKVTNTEKFTLSRLQPSTFVSIRAHMGSCEGPCGWDAQQGKGHFSRDQKVDSASNPHTFSPIKYGCSNILWNLECQC